MAAKDFNRRLSRNEPRKESGLSLYIASRAEYKAILRRIRNETGSFRFIAGCRYGKLKDLDVLAYNDGPTDPHISLRCLRCDIEHQPRCKPIGDDEAQCQLYLRPGLLQARLGAMFKVQLGTNETLAIDRELGFMR